MGIRDALARLSVPPELRTNTKPQKQKAKANAARVERSRKHRYSVGRFGSGATIPLQINDD